ncbi:MULTISPECIES: prepilin peptidase [Marinobacter]|jgi:leader peptidase (prepilin peptidase)/N-methyltransferase|uniref:Prepilin leader peptidase/N-methyltransferase n=2 Tax=Marinobacter TaxID=2742 RepID=A0ABY1FI92_9GAMM|nr:MULTISPECIES: A24 family peptidase [Marinobacter]KXJ43801.1 MAG: methyltransferase [Marinobacter sp. Hex_13]MBS8230172.1 prepilin peptidase [Marinobacter salarius]OLF82167.1 methyltransferase [Marinobacter sp. C18]RUT75314.1 prepilin peptidase [Marinobacter sp. NP-6]SFL40790.1 leader peptidase (prepilin peptidase) / N-methyltransferase [Marinobacter salarius]|tara:strand:- start:7360 stop:8235 length:876 start_codon:yes stop_codon:yes gene_type:complete
MISVDTFLATPWLLYTAVIFFSLCIGSFLNVVILRLPKMMQQDWRCQCEEFLELSDDQRKNDEPITLSKPASTCPSCGHGIRAWENVPVISYLVLGGKCASCKAGISPRYPIIEAITALFSVVTILVMGPSEAALWSLLLVWVLIALTVIDFDTQLLPDSMTLPLMWLGLILNYFGVLTDFSSAFWGAVAGYLSLWSVYWLFKLVTGKEGMGHGDFKLLAALGAWLGWELLPAVILLSSLVGAVVGISLMVFRKHGREVPIPFGPYLAAAGLLCLWFGSEIQAAWYAYLGV